MFWASVDPQVSLYQPDDHLQIVRCASSSIEQRMKKKKKLSAIPKSGNRLDSMITFPLSTGSAEPVHPPSSAVSTVPKTHRPAGKRIGVIMDENNKHQHYTHLDSIEGFSLADVMDLKGRSNGAGGATM